MLSKAEESMLRQPELLSPTSKDWKAEFSKNVLAQIRGAKSICFIGTGTSYHCALWAHWLCQLESRGKITSSAISSIDFLSGLAEQRDSKKLYVVISHRGARTLTLEVLKRLKANKRILLCGEGSPHEKNPVVFVSPQEISNAHTISLSGALSATAEIVALFYPTAARRIRQNRKLTAEFFAQAPTTLSSPGISFERLAVVGMGPLHSAALEVALKSREMAHIHAQGYNVEELLHGPLASITSQDRVLLLTPSNAPALYHERTAALLDRLKKTGATLLPFQINSDLPLVWQAICAIRIGQAFALAQAYARKINPDLNAYL